MSDDPASHEALKWEIRSSLVKRLGIPWEGMGDMANQQRAEAAVQIVTMMDEIEAWKQAMQKAERDMAGFRDQLEVEENAVNHPHTDRNNLRLEVERLRGMLEVQDEMVKHYVEERDEARIELCERDAAERTKSAWSSGLSMRYLWQDIARERGWDCFKEKP